MSPRYYVIKNFINFRYQEIVNFAINGKTSHILNLNEFYTTMKHIHNTSIVFDINIYILELKEQLQQIFPDCKIDYIETKVTMILIIDW